MGGVDKGLVAFRGAPMVAAVIARLAPQVGAIVVNANQNAGRVLPRSATASVPDAVGGFAGPLAGLHAGLAAVTTRYAVTVPCDSPFLPHDLVARLGAALEAHDAELAVARTFDQPHRCSRSSARTSGRISKRSSREAAGRSTRGTRRCESSRSRSTTRPTRSATSTRGTNSRPPGGS
jgi:GTP:adenosylcobinamide-phosphate guanylyltransferase